MKTILLLGLGLLGIIPDRKPHNRLIKRWASLFHLKIKYYSRYTERFEVDIVEEVMYISRYNKAVHDPQEYLYSVSHEFGHLIDAAYQEYYENDTYFQRLLDKNAIYEDEKKAWQIGKLLLQQANLYESKSFNKLKRKCLKDYRKALKL